MRLGGGRGKCPLQPPTATTLRRRYCQICICRYPWDFKDCLTQTLQKQTYFCFWLSPWVFSNHQQSKHHEKISIWGWIYGLIAKTAVDYWNLLWYEMKGYSLHARILPTDNDVQSSYFLLLLFILFYLFILFMYIILLLLLLLLFIIIIIMELTGTNRNNM